MMSEHDHQVEIFKWAKLHETREPRLKLLYAIPNGGLRNKITAAGLKAEGVKAGVPDMCLPVPWVKILPQTTMSLIFTWSALYIELKKPGGRKPTKTQLKIHELLQSECNRVEVCYGHGEAITVLKEYLGMK